jgi:hypothetical protein
MLILTVASESSALSVVVDSGRSLQFLSVPVRPATVKLRFTVL